MNVLDRVISWVSPQAAYKRQEFRKMLESQRESYDAGKLNRLRDSWIPKQESGESPDYANIARMRSRAWDLYRNNPYCRRVVTAIVAHILGCGLEPSPQAQNASREPDEVFRDSAKRLWADWTTQASFLGLPGFGGLTFDEIAAQALTECVVSGEVLVRFRTLPKNVSANERRILPFSIELIAAERLVDEYSWSRNSAGSTQIPDGHYLYRGIEFDRNDRRAAYHVADYHPNDPRPGLHWIQTKRIPADQIIHLYRPDRPDQFRGVSWLSPIVLHLRDIADYQENELQSSLTAACIMMTIETEGGAPLPGLNTPASGQTADKDGNPLTRMQPNMILNLAKGERANIHNPSRPNSTAEVFINHLLRGVAAGMGTLKASTITGDYKGSSYTSEKANDNDVWRNIEQYQEWIAGAFHQQVYARLIDEGIDAGYFDALDGRAFNRSRYLSQRDRFIKCNWNGPVQQSVNPAVDVKADQLSVASGFMSTYQAIVSRGWNPETVVSEEVDYHKLTDKAGLDQIMLDKAKKQAEVAAIGKPAPTGGKVPGKSSNGGSEGNIGQNA